VNEQIDLSMVQMLPKLQAWYLSHCDGDWEHSYGVRIDTLDNPGWSITVDLVGTELEHTPLTSTLFGVSEEDAIQGGSGNVNWHVCKRSESQFLGYGGPRDLSMLINVFLSWAEESLKNGLTGPRWGEAATQYDA
jgi:hypothetical protein